MSQIEDERKFVIAGDQPVPDLSGVVELGPSERFTLHATYVDTLDLTLARNRIVLRRRTGGGDEGWHLKLPGTDGRREEVHAPLSDGPNSAMVPNALRSRVADLIGNEALVPVATVRNKRTERELRLGKTVVALLCDDHVRASRGRDEKSWRELEVELVDGDRELLDRITEVFAAAGVPVSTSPSKLVTILGEPGPASGELGPDSAALDVLRAYWSTQVGVLQALREPLRTDEPDAVHQARVATRRLRSVLRTWRPLLKKSVVDNLRAELKWLGGKLGAPRDGEVLRARLMSALDALPDSDVDGPVRERMEATLVAAHQASLAKLTKALDSQRFATLCASLTRLLTHPPIKTAAERKARKVLPPHLDKAVDRTRWCWRQARGMEAFDQALMLHETRKKAKACRYGGEAVVPAFGEGAQQWAATWKDVTEPFGVFQDSIVAQRRLAELRAEALAAGEPTRPYDRLADAQAAEGETALAEATAALTAALQMSANRWRR